MPIPKEVMEDRKKTTYMSYRDWGGTSEHEGVFKFIEVKYRTDDIARLRDRINVGDKVRFLMWYPGSQPMWMTGFISDKYTHHCIVQFRSPSGYISHRSFQYLQFLLRELDPPFAA